jgi:probable rRNA maturation factor
MKRPRGAAPAIKILAAPAVDILVESARWSGRRGVQPLLRRAIAGASAALPARAARSTSGAELAIVLTNDSAIRKLNRTWRGKDEPTNVLAFPADQQAGRPRLLGDVVIAYETLAREARTERKPFDHHLAHLAVHGFLHLCGYDHESDRQAATMERLETAILARLGVPDPYIARTRGD